MHRALLCLLIAALPLGALADVYRSVDAQGHVQYSDTPSPGAQLITDAEDSAPLDSTDASKAASQAQKVNTQISDQLAHDAAARQVAKDSADAQAKQCQQAQQAYQQAIQARRLYTQAADGTRQYMTNDEADQRRVNAKLAMDAACNSSDSQ